MQFSSEEGLPETAVKAKQRLFMMAVTIVSHLKNFLIFLAHPVVKVNKY